MSKIEVTHGTATVEIEGRDTQHLAGDLDVTYQPRDLVAATVKALRAIDSHPSHAMASLIERAVDGG